MGAPLFGFVEGNRTKLSLILRLFGSARFSMTQNFPFSEAHSYVRARLTEVFGKDWSFRSAAQGSYWLDEIEIGAVK